MKTSEPSRNVRSHLLHRQMPWLVVLAGVLITAGLFWKARQETWARFQTAFEGDASIRANILTDALQERLMDVEALRRFYQGSTHVDRQEFRAFVGPVPGSRAGVQAIAWVPRVLQAERARVEAEARHDGLTNFQFTQRAPGGEIQPAAPQDVYYPVYCLEPRISNATVLGLDLTSIPGCTQAMERAMVTGNPAATERLQLPANPFGQPGIIVFVPVYSNAVPAETVAEKRAALEGFATGMFRIDEIIASVLKNTPALGMPVDLVDLGAPPAEQLMYHWNARLPMKIQSPPTSDPADTPFHYTRNIEFGGRPWRLNIFASAARRQTRLSPTYWVIPPLGLLITGLLGFYVSMLVSHQERSENLVQERTTTLREREAILEAITTSARDAITMMDAEGRITFWNPAAARIFGWPSTKAIGRKFEELVAPPACPDPTRRVFQDLQSIGLGQAVGETLELVLLRKDKQEISVELSLSSVVLDGQWHAVGILRDITERKRAQEQLARAEKQYHELVNNLTVGVYRNTPGEHGRFLEANPTMVTMFEATSKEEFMQHPVSDLYIDATRRREFSEKIMKQGFLKDEELQLQTLRGRRFWAAVSATMKTDEAGQVFFDGVIEDITDRKHAEESLQRERILLRTVIDNAPDIIYAKDPACRRTLSNRADLQILNRKSEAEVLGKTDFDFFPKQNAEKTLAEDQSVIQTGQAVLNREDSFIDLRGEERWLLTSKLPLRDEHGQIIGLVGIGHDITARKRAEDAIQRERILLRTLIDNLPDTIYVKDAACRKTVANRADVENIGCAAEADVLGKTDFELFPHDIAARGYADDQAVVRTGQPVLNREEDFYDARGKQRWLSTSKLPLRDERGQIIGLVGIGHDVTERKRAEEAVQRERILLRTLIDNLPDTIYVKDTVGRKTVANRADYENMGRASESEVLGKTDFEIFPPDIAARGHADDQAVLQSGQPVLNREEDFYDAQGRQRWLLTSKLPLRDEHSQIVGLVGIGHDITEMKRTQEELRRAKETAEAASRAKSEFLANMSHEIRTPMNGVIGMTGLLLDTDLTAEQREFAETIRNSGETLLTLINDVLDFSKIEAGRLDLEMLDFDLRETVEDTAEILALRAQQKGLEFICLIEPQVPSLVQGDPGRLRQILANLSSNAIKFTAKGEISIHLGLEEEATDHTAIHFEVTDSGIGIPPDKLGKLFQPFTQVDASTTRRFGGSGLGLSISRRLVEMMGGSIGVESVEGKGSRFWFKIPFGRPSPEARLAWKPAPEISGHRALVVDDNATNRRVVTLLLKTWGCEFEEAEDAESALLKLRAAQTSKRPFDLALLDMHMPGMDGEELGRQIKADPAVAKLPLVMLTSLCERGHLERLKQIGFAGFLTKPIKQAQLYQCLALVLGHPEAAAEAQSARFIAGHALPKMRKRARILLAEDNITNQKVALAILEKLGYRADAVANGREVLRSLETLPYSLVLMDCQMPEMDGYEATRLIRDPSSRVRSHDIPVIAMTAYAMQGDREKCLQVGMNDYISKPVQPKELAEALERWLSANELTKAHAASARKETPVSAAATVFDEKDLLDRMMGDESMARSISQSFVREAAQHIAGLTKALGASDVATATRHAHSLKGSSANLGAPQLREISAEIERLIRAGELAQATERLPQLTERFDALRAAMSRFLQEEQQGPS